MVESNPVVRLYIEILEVLVQIGTTALRQAIAIAHPQDGGTGGKAEPPTIRNPCSVVAARNAGRA